MIEYLRNKALAHVKANPIPDLIIGGDVDPYLLRWYWMPRNKLFNVYIHRFLKDDQDEALHDHPWPSYSIMCEGHILENFIGKHRNGEPYSAYRDFTLGMTVYRPAKFAHKIIVIPGRKLPLTIFITGPRIREWGFHCPKGWVHWKKFLGVGTNKPTGCGEYDE